MKQVKNIIHSALVISLLSACNYQTETKNTIEEKEPTSIIFMIGDGMGVPQFSTAYYFGQQEPNFSQFKQIGFHQTSDKTHRITDSAAGATAFAIGEKTYKRAIGVNADTLAKESILKRLQKKGYSTGLVSLTSITHATPAAFYAHVPDRDLHEDIALQLMDADIDFLAGGVKKFFNKRTDNKDLFKELQNKGYHLDTTNLSEPQQNQKSAFILAEEGLPSKIEGRKDYLSEATTKAITHLGATKKPFFLMVEGSYIDWGGHAKNDEMVITEVQDFDKTLGVVMQYVKENPNTLLVVTADHETGGVSIGKFYETDTATGEKKEVPTKAKVYFNTDQHSGELIPVFAMGQGAEHFQGIYQNNAIFHKMMKVANLDKQ